MSENQWDMLHQIRAKEEDLSQLQMDYWGLFSHLGTWQFWVVLAALVVPLIVLFWAIDKKHSLHLAFFGLNYHLWFAYINKIGISLGYWEYPYPLISFVPSFALDASLVPVSFMLLYQWTLTRKKNMYLYSILLSALLAFVLKPILVHFHFFHMYKWVNYVYLFLFYYAFFLVSKLITNIFLWMSRQSVDQQKAG